MIDLERLHQDLVWLETKLWNTLYGDHFTGPSGTVDDKGRSLVFSIAQDRRTERAHYDAGWAHNAGLPVQLSMRPDGDLGVSPVEEVSLLHVGEPLLNINQPTSVADANARLETSRGTCCTSS